MRPGEYLLCLLAVLATSLPTQAKKRAGSQYYALASGPGSSPWGENLDEARDPSLIAKDFETSDLRYFAEKMAEMSQNGTYTEMPSIALNASDLQRVAFGNEAPQGAIPFAVALEILASDSMYTCGASLIGKQTIISAAHCFFDERGNLLALKAQAVVGERSISRPQRLYKVTGLVRPKDFAPAYTNQLYGDIVIAKLERTPSTGKVVALASSNTKVPKWLVTAGWGLTEDNRRTSNVLKYAAVPSLSLTQVKAWGQYSGTYYTMERDHVAAGLGSDRADSCQGDSGGPLFIPGSGFTNSESKNDLLYGVVSYGLSSQCGTRQNMNIGFYTSIPYWRSWILKEMKKKKWR